MIATSGRNRDRVRAIFVSDVHLGCRHSQAEAFLEFLFAHQPERIYLVGDIIDGWKLKHRWRWPEVYHRIFRRFYDLAQDGCELYFTPGNHDAFLRHYQDHFGFIHVQDEFVHETAGGRRLLVLHGDRFDRVEQELQWLSLIGSYAYDTLLSVNWLVNRIRKKRFQYYAFSNAVKQRIKLLVKSFSEFERKIITAAREQDCDGVICGHIHAPKLVKMDGITYGNTGDWVENCTALIETESGLLELLRYDFTGEGMLLQTEDATEQEVLPVDRPRPVSEPVLDSILSTSGSAQPQSIVSS